LDNIATLPGVHHKKVFVNIWDTFIEEMISKMDESRKWKNVHSEKGRKNYRRLWNILERTTEKAKK
jgi:hypothetical protein